MLELVSPVPNTDTDTGRLVTLQEAADVLGVSVRTIRRRVRSGELVSTMIDGRRLVSLAGVPRDHSGSGASQDTVSRHARGHVPDTSPLVSDLRARIAELEGERDRARQDTDRWQEQAGHWQTMSQDLSQRLSEVTGTLYRLTEAKALPPAPEPKETPTAPWWAFWRR